MTEGGIEGIGAEGVVVVNGKRRRRGDGRSGGLLLRIAGTEDGACPPMFVLVTYCLSLWSFDLPTFHTVQLFLFAR